MLMAAPFTKANGGMMGPAIACDNAVETVLSGPAAGAISAAHIAVQAGLANVISGDMGGTSFDVALILNGKPAVSSEREIDYSVPVRIPLIDIHTIGAGGGSIASVNRAGMRRSHARGRRHVQPVDRAHGRIDRQDEEGQHDVGHAERRLHPDPGKTQPWP